MQPMITWPAPVAEAASRNVRLAGRPAAINAAGLRLTCNGFVRDLLIRAGKGDSPARAGTRWPE